MVVNVFGYISIQPDWTVDVSTVLESGAPGKFWVSAYKLGEASIHGSIQVAKTVSADGTALVDLSVDDAAITAEYVSPRQLRLSRSGASPVLYTGPRSTVVCSQVVRGTGVRSFDVSLYGGLLAAGGDDGVLDVYDTQKGQHRVSLEGHIGDITSCLFFPSGQVVLSAATDLRLRVWSASDGTNPVTLVGHTAAITDTAIVGQGKNVLSAGKDGTLRLWHCGSASVLYTFDLSKKPINAIDLVAGTESGEELPENEFETAGKIVAVACEDSRALLVDLRGRETIVAFTSDAPVRAVAYALAHGLLFAGRADGVVDVWMTDAPAAPAYAFKRNNSPISALRLVQRTEAGLPLLCVGTEDGQLYLVALEMAGGKVTTAEVVEELVAFDVDPITQIRAAPSTASGATRQSVWASGRTGKVYQF
ncbi:hypothetical protein H4S07_001880 [Coemansia furcata]|uniref:Uncharacterized protein n=1 Tax=Coemansia furcata TaxID=417177 RepID=A0ACC1LN93_9FUNG|nr:hypothetical protein H4S07_001880 [Coemansia furcata]